MSLAVDRALISSLDITVPSMSALTQLTPTMPRALGLALIVNEKNPQDVISLKELRQILSGEIKTWDEMWPTKLGTAATACAQQQCDE